MYDLVVCAFELLLSVQPGPLTNNRIHAFLSSEIMSGPCTVKVTNFSH